MPGIECSCGSRTVQGHLRLADPPGDRIEDYRVRLIADILCAAVRGYRRGNPRLRHAARSLMFQRPSLFREIDMHRIPLFLLAMTIGSLFAWQARADATGPCASIAAVAQPSISGAAEVKQARGRLHFVSGSERRSCPSLSPGCREAAYVLPQDWVLTGQTIGDFVCALAQDLQGHKTQGLLPVKALQPASPAIFGNWYGFWVIPGDVKRITIQHVDDTTVSVSAELYGVVINGLFKPDGDHMDFAVSSDSKPVPLDAAGDATCRLHLRIVGPFLVVEDNRTCGEAYFNGIYERS
jgi:hypothetical protein